MYHLEIFGALSEFSGNQNGGNSVIVKIIITELFQDTVQHVATTAVKTF
jgi:hypothetical protein